MADNIEILLEKLIDFRGPCKKLCEEGKIEELKLIIDEFNEPIIDENGDFILWE